MKASILKQLKKCKNVDLSYLTGEETEIIIKKCETISQEMLSLDKTYIIKVDDYMLSLNENNSALVTNWNSGQVLRSKYLRVSLNQIMNNMYRFDGVGFNLDTCQVNGDFYTSFWIPKDHFVVIREIAQ